jgi:hypothetical protein
LGAIMEHMAYFPSGPSLHCPCDKWNPRYLTVSWQFWTFFWEILYPAFHKRERRRWVPSIQSSWVGPTNRSSSIY